MKTIRIMAFCLCLIFLSAAGASAEILKVLLLSDIYTLDSSRKNTGGMGRLITAIERERALRDHDILLTVHTGDAISPSIFTRLDQGKTMIDVLNRIGLDIFVPGNHEFDLTYDVLVSRLGESKFPWVLSNVLYRNGRIPGMRPSMVIEKGGVRIGFAGALTSDIRPVDKSFRDLSITPYLPSLSDALAGIAPKKPDFNIVLSHLEYYQDIEILNKLPSIAGVLGSHNHFPFLWGDGGKFIVKPGAHGEWLAVLYVHLKDKKPNYWEIRYVAIDDRFHPAEWFDDLISLRRKELSPVLQREVGISTVILEGSRKSLRSGESNLGNMVADAMRLGTKAEIAFQHSGGLRWEEDRQPGIIRVEDIYRLLPFGNTVTIVEMNGVTLIKTLEAGVEEAGEDNRVLLHPSGLRYAYDKRRKTGNRVCSAEVMENASWVPVSREKKYTVAIPDYLYNGGHSFGFIREESKVIVSPEAGIPEIEVVTRLISESKEIAPAREGRIREGECRL